MRRFNILIVDEVEIVIFEVQSQPRDIIHRRRSLTKIAETHRCYDALQYLIIFLGWFKWIHFNVKMINPIMAKKKIRNVAQKNYYSYRPMIRENEDDHILKYRQLFNHYIVDVYAKIATEHLIFIRLCQIKLSLLRIHSVARCCCK